jgi:hypothetical protein
MVDLNKKAHQVKCKTCTKIEGKEKLLDLKLDNFWQHANGRKTLVAVLSSLYEFIVPSSFPSLVMKSQLVIKVLGSYLCISG